MPFLRVLPALFVSVTLTVASLAAAITPPGGNGQTSAPGVVPQAAPVPLAANARDQQLITNAEKAYADGLANLQAGHAQAARASFDYAVDLLLSSGADLKNNAALSAELDRIVDSINTLELDALRQPGAPATQTDEPTPIEIGNEAATFPVDPGVKAQALAELRTTQSDLPLVVNDYVAGFINYLSNTTRGRNTIVASLNRAGKYKTMIERVLKEEGVPQDLVYQAVQESGFRPRALNPRSGAAGMWQFMPYGTYGLAKTGWYDERFDPEKATRAYAHEMKKAYNQLGDWYLAMAAYDWGTGNVQRAVQRTGYVDFWELYRRNNLPGETKNYVPIILAVAIMAKNPKQYGLESITPDAAILPDTVTTNYAIDLHLVADLTGTSHETIEELNPSLLRGKTPPDEPYALHVPAGMKNLFAERVAQIPEDKRTLWRYHRVAAGDTLEQIAHEFHSTASDIAFVNQISESTSLAGIEALIIPVAPPRSVAGARASVYQTRRGDTLVTIADQFGVTVDQLRRWNKLTARSLVAGRKLYVAEPARLSRNPRGRFGRARSATRISHPAPSKGHASAARPAPAKRRSTRR